MDWDKALVLLAALALMAAAGYFILKILERSLRADAPASLIGVLSVIVIMGVVGYVGFGEARPELIALASTATGALVATLTGWVKRPDCPDCPPGDSMPPEPDTDEQNATRDID